MLGTWQRNDVGERALGSIKARATVMASQTDLYFTPDDVRADAAQIREARFRVIPSLWGHMAGAGLNTADSEFIASEIRTLLAESPGSTMAA